MVAFYQRSISAWMDGTEGLDDGEYRAYDVVCNLIYLNDGPIVMHESGIAGRCNQHPLRFRRNFAKLVEKGKLVVCENGKISNARVELELKKIRRSRAPKSADPGRTPAAPSLNPRGVPVGSSGGNSDKPLKDKEPTLFGGGLENRREESLPDGRAGAMLNPPPDPEADLYRRGREVLGTSAGGMIRNLLIAKGGNVALARAAIEQASQRGDAREYVGAMVRGVKGGAARGNAFANMRAERFQQKQEREHNL